MIHTTSLLDRELSRNTEAASRKYQNWYYQWRGHFTDRNFFIRKPRSLPESLQKRVDCLKYKDKEIHSDIETFDSKAQWTF